jgi:mRNA interferase RelE/StbE
MMSHRASKRIERLKNPGKNIAAARHVRGRMSGRNLVVADRPSWRVIVTARAEKDLKSLPVDGQARIRSALDRLAEDPLRGDIKKLQGVVDEWRLRVGDWRVRFRPDFDEKVLVILRVLPRGNA